MNSKLTRFAALAGDKITDTLQKKKIAIFGLGAVGAFTAEFLARCGASQLLVIDFDHVTPSNFNRLITATDQTTGKSKALIMKERILSINPNAQIKAFQKFIGPENIADFLAEQKTEIIIDAIDSLNPKLALLETALNNNHTIFSSMGAGGRIQAGAVQKANLWDTHSCRLATQIRKRLRRRGVNQPLPVVFSTELAKAPLPPEQLAENEKSIYHDRGRERSIQPSVVYIPAIFAGHLTEMVIEECGR